MKTVPLRIRFGVLPLLFLVLVLTAGCGKPKGSVSGKVKYQGKPLPGGFVTFVLEKGAPRQADIQSNGAYRLDKVPVGNVKIIVQPPNSLDEVYLSKQPPLPKTPEDMKKIVGPSTAKGVTIPDKYANPETSGLTYTVQEGPQEHDIDLK